MNSLRIEKKNVYQIEVNDNGEYIEFDLDDINLNMKYFNALDQLQRMQDEFEQKEKKLKNEKAADIEFTKLEQELFEKLRSIMDSFLGENACQKIFGDRNYYNMFPDLIYELEKPRKELNNKSHLDMLHISTTNLRKKIIEKYTQSEGEVI